jgi:hypothetical protein
MLGRLFDDATEARIDDREVAYMRVLPVALSCAMLLNVESSQIYVNWMAAPASIEALGRAADVIAIGTIDQVTDIERPAAGGHTTPWMECILTLSDVVKRDDRLSTLDTFVTFYVVGSHESYEIGFRPFESGEELLVYLHWATGMTGYVLAFGPDGAYKVVNGGGALIRPITGCSST